eukprot:TRINITY_DN257_c0_g1_i1.p1 TRINITY_DN257_c0_g1~~TRINITY_DN257_c0_g1_i1.p1  ORF type:complete len:459 (+),score=148.45 TRINITY_DN257_c0_g1_i1:128-1504(+)
MKKSRKKEIPAQSTTLDSFFGSRQKTKKVRTEDNSADLSSNSTSSSNLSSSSSSSLSDSVASIDRNSIVDTSSLPLLSSSSSSSLSCTSSSSSSSSSSIVSSSSASSLSSSTDITSAFSSSSSPSSSSSSSSSSSLTEEQRQVIATKREAARQRLARNKRKAQSESIADSEKEGEEEEEGKESPGDNKEEKKTEKKLSSSLVCTESRTTSSSSSSSSDWKIENVKGNGSFANMEEYMDPSWRAILADEFKKPYFIELKKKLVAREKAGAVIFPPARLIFSAFNYCKLANCRVVILGQDPYHSPGQAEGLCFSVARGVPIPSSLKNMYSELTKDIPGFVKPKHGNLVEWAQQGVLLLNAILTVEKGQPLHHKGWGWEKFTDAVLGHLTRSKKNLVFLLWGNQAKAKCKSIDKTKHHILEAAHPSGLSASRGFFGCKHFSKCNAFLTKNGMSAINWRISP